MLLPVQFLQGVSNACIWITCCSLITDMWKPEKIGSIIGSVIGIYSLGIMAGILIGGIMITDN
jgi:MFS family permease